MSARAATILRRGLAAALLLLPPLLVCGCNGGREEAAPGAPTEAAVVDPLEAARAALEARRWDDALQQAELAIEADIEADAARELAGRARAEAANQARLADAHALFVAEQYTRAYTKLVGFPPESAYAGQVANMLVRIRHAAVLPERITRRHDMPMRRVVIGSFMRGSDLAEAARAHKLCEKHAGDCRKHWFDREQPRRRIVTGSFYLDEREVSVGQYQACVAEGGCAPVDWNACGVTEEQRAAHQGETLPQVCVTWDEARAYCEHAGGRLPTEAEWERAAAGPRNWRFPWGEAWHAWSANWADGEAGTDGHRGLAPVDAYEPAAWGLRNLAGNAYEWVADWYAEDYYAGADETHPRGPAEGAMRVIRGGAYNSSPSSMRVAHRNRMDPADRDRTVGLRCAASPEQLPL